MNPEMDAIYILSPEPHIVECLLLDLQKRRYRSPKVFFTGVVNSSQSRKLTEAGLSMTTLADFIVTAFLTSSLQDIAQYSSTSIHESRTWSPSGTNPVFPSSTVRTAQILRTSIWIF